jgi:hypothetical protein
MFLEIAPHAVYRLMPPGRIRFPAASAVDLDRDFERGDREIESPLSIRVKPEFRLELDTAQRRQHAPRELERAFG